MATTLSPATDLRQSSGRGYLWLGIGLVLLGPVLFIAQLQAKVLNTPWYALALATVGVALLLFAAIRKVTIWRIVALLLFGLLAAGQWYFVVVESKLPAYTGPVAAGVSFPAFHSNLADGSDFSQDSLPGDKNTVLVFFRGRW